MLKKLCLAYFALIGALSGLASIAEYLKIPPESVLGVVLDPFKAVGNWLWGEHLVSGWLIVTMSAASFVVAILVIDRLRKRLIPIPNEQPAFRKYIQDRIFDVVCRWRWNSYNEPDDVRYFCPTCEGELGYTDQAEFVAVPRTGLGCYNCKKLLAEFDGDTDFVDERILSEIDRRARVDHGKPTH